MLTFTKRSVWFDHRCQRLDIIGLVSLLYIVLRVYGNANSHRFRQAQFEKVPSGYLESYIGIYEK